MKYFGLAAVPSVAVKYVPLEFTKKGMQALKAFGFCCCVHVGLIAYHTASIILKISTWHIIASKLHPTFSVAVGEAQRCVFLSAID